MTGRQDFVMQEKRQEQRIVDGCLTSFDARNLEPAGLREIPLLNGRRVRPEIAAFGEWESTNLGDRAIHHGVLQFFTECGWNVSSYGLGPLTPVAAGAADKEVAPAMSERRAALWLAPPIKRALRAFRQRYRMRRLLPLLSQAQAISVGGGAVLSDANLHFPQSLAMLTEAARVLNKPLFCLGCSAEGSWSSRGNEMIREFIASCTVVAPRDEATAERIATVLRRPVPIFGDFCLTEARVLTDGLWRRPRHGLAVNVFRVPPPWSAAQERYEDALVALINHLVQSDTRCGPRPIRIFTTNTPDDAIPAQRVFTRLAGEGAELHLPRSLDELTGLLRESALVIASRLHGAILALAENALVVGFSPVPKLNNYFSTMGLGEYSFDLHGGARLAGWLDGADYESILAVQRRALLRAPAWAGRAQARSVLESIAGALSNSEIACT